MYTNCVFVAMSGGVDSSVAAYLLKEDGYNIIGITMRLYEPFNSNESDKNISLAKSVTDKLGAPFLSVDMREEFKLNVIKRFIDEYENGLTPNPCIVCNNTIKFGKLFEYLDRGLSQSDNPSMIATGHYAIIEKNTSGRYMLRKARDLSKDQSYFLYTLSQDVLSRTIFPLGKFSSKDEIRKIAEEQGFINSKKKDSQDVCFIPDGKYSGFINSFTGSEPCPGYFVDMNGKILGTHKGIVNYTIGQRKGLDLSLKKPMYVYSLDISSNEIVLADNNDLFGSKLIADNLNWISIEAPDVGAKLHALGRIRYRHAEAPCTVTILEGGKAEVVFDEPQRAITPGQSVVFYDTQTASYVLGGGTIQP